MFVVIACVCAANSEGVSYSGGWSSARRFEPLRRYPSEHSAPTELSHGTRSAATNISSLRDSFLGTIVVEEKQEDPDLVISSRESSHGPTVDEIQYPRLLAQLSRNRLCSFTSKLDLIGPIRDRPDYRVSAAVIPFADRRKVMTPRTRAPRVEAYRDL